MQGVVQLRAIYVWLGWWVYGVVCMVGWWVVVVGARGCIVEGCKYGGVLGRVTGCKGLYG